MVLEERINLFDYQLRNFNEGFFFFYFSSIDQNTHMLWRAMDPSHPLYNPQASKEVKQAIRYFYKRFDDVLRQTLGHLDSHSTLMLMSDHGFAPFSREVHLSTWLVENGFTAVTDESKYHSSQFYQYVDWKKTKAYVMGLNGIYLNIDGRDKNGSVDPHKAQALKDEIIAKLNEFKDPKNGEKVITQAYDSSKVYSGPYLSLAPDIILGYKSGYRISDEAVLGKFPKGTVGDRTDPWAADHCMDPSYVPGILLSNKEVMHPSPALWDLAPTILKEFGFKAPKEMEGKPIFDV